MVARLVSMLAVAMAIAVQAADTPTVIGWRTDTTGRYPDATPPLHWAADRNVAWTTPLPGRSSSSPVLIGNRILLTADPDWLICVRAADGKVLWQTENAIARLASKEDQDDFAARVAHRTKLAPEVDALQREAAAADAQAKANPTDAALRAAAKQAAENAALLTREMERLPNGKVIKPNGTVGWSCCTPISDGKVVVALYNSGMLVCYDLAGTLQWAHFLQTVGIPFGQSMSPTLAGGVVGVCIDNCMYGIELATGKTLWTDYEPLHQGSPAGLLVGKVPVFMAGEGTVRDARSGTVLAKADGVLTLYGAPAIVGDTAYSICDTYRVAATRFCERDGGIAVQAGGFGIERGLYYASPLVTDDTVYVWNTANYDGPKAKPRTLLAYDRRTGVQVCRVATDLGGWGYPSPCQAGPFVYIANDKGTTVVYLPQKDRSLKEVARNSLEAFVSTPVFAGDRMYVRTMTTLYCIVAPNEDKVEAQRLLDERDKSGQTPQGG